MTLLTSVLWETWNALLVAAPFLIVGMLGAGLLRVLLARRHVERWLGHEGLLGVTVAAGLGIPLPLCSCGVVPVAIALRRKGASRAASLSFLITTPESGIDSILLTWGMLGPVMAIARPLASFVTALVAGVATIAWPEPDEDGATAVARGAIGHASQAAVDEAGVIGPREFWRSLRAYVRTPRPSASVDPASIPPAATAGAPPPFEDVVREVCRYAFVEFADDIVFWLVLGLVLAGMISALMPADLAARGLGNGFGPMVFLLLVGGPLYLCASASTPVAAALVAKGVSPGAALVFLLSGPATNAATIVLLARHFGARFVRLYLGSIAVATLACGLALDWFLAVTGWRVTAALSGGLGGVALVQWLSAAGLSILIVWRLWAGAGRRGAHELIEHFEMLVGLAVDADARARQAFWQRNRRRAARAAFVLLALAYALSGLRSIPADARGYGLLFGRLVWPDLAPGLHYIPPWPVGRCDVWRTPYPRLAAVGFTPSITAVGERRRLTRQAGGNLWHSPVTAANTDVQTATYLTGDENLLEVSFAVQYQLSDPSAYFYRVDKNGDPVRLYAEAAARDFIARTRLDELLTSARVALEASVADYLQRRLDALGTGVTVSAVIVVDLHPPQGAVEAFRDVSSAREERETTINLAAAKRAKAIPEARGQAELERANAKGAAATAATVAVGEAAALKAQAQAFLTQPQLLGELLWMEAAERALRGREKLIVPPGSAGDRVVVWKDAPPLPSTAPAAPLGGSGATASAPREEGP